MTVLERSELDASPLADLHAIADQIGLDGFRRLRKADLIDAILERSGGDGRASAPDGASARERSADTREQGAGAGEDGAGEEREARPARRRRPTRRRAKAANGDQERESEIAGPCDFPQDQFDCTQIDRRLRVVDAHAM